MSVTKYLVLLSACVLAATAVSLQRNAASVVQPKKVQVQKFSLEDQINQCIDENKLDEMTGSGGNHSCSCECEDSSSSPCSCSCTTSDARHEGAVQCPKEVVHERLARSLQQRRPQPQIDEVDEVNMKKMSYCLQRKQQPGKSTGAVGHRSKRFGSLHCWLSNCKWRRVWFIWVRICNITCKWTWWWGK